MAAFASFFGGAAGWNHAGGELMELPGGDQGEYAPPPDLLHDVLQLMRKYSWEQMVNGARAVYATYPLVSGAVHDKSNHVIGTAWTPVFYGKNQEWGDRATKWITEWYKRCDERGKPYDFQRNLWIGSCHLEHSGDFGLILKRTATGAPRLRYIESHRIGQRIPNTFIPFGEYAGLKIVNGIVYSDGDEPIAYSIMGATPVDDFYVEAKNFIHVYDPVWFTQGRGIPTISYGINDWLRSKHIRDNEQTAQDIYSRLTLIENNDTGRADPAQSRVASRTTGDPANPTINVQSFSRGEIRYVKAGSKNGVTAFNSGRPGNGFFQHYDMTVRGAFVGMSWPLEWGYDLSTLGGATMRAMTDKINRTVGMRQAVLKAPALLAISFALSCAIDNGELPFEEEFLNWDFETPGDATVDDGNDSTNDRADIDAGLASYSSTLARRGRNWLREVTQKAKDVAALHELADKFKLDPTELRMLTPNANSAPETAGKPGVSKPMDKALPAKSKAAPEDAESILDAVNNSLADFKDDILSAFKHTEFDPSQLRLPKGVEGGGRWTRAQGDLVSTSLAEIVAKEREKAVPAHWKEKLVKATKKDGSPAWDKDTGKQKMKDEGGWVITATGKPAPDHIKAVGKRANYKDVRISTDPKSMLHMTSSNGAPVYHPMKSAAESLANHATVRDLHQKEAAIMKENDANRKSADENTSENASLLRLVHEAGIRAGSTDDGKANSAKGATTLEARHVSVDKKGDVHLKFNGKHSVPQHFVFENDGTSRGEIGQHLAVRAKMAMEDEGKNGKLFDTNYGKFSKYVKSLGGKGGGFSAKNFRTLKAGNVAMAFMAKMPAPKTHAEFDAAVQKVGEHVSVVLGHATPDGAMALKSYIDPFLFAEWRSKLRH